MAERIKHTYEVTVNTIGGGTFTATDTDDSRAGYAAYQYILHGDTVKIPGENSDTLIPYHAIDYAVVTDTTSTEEYTDDTCVEEGETGETGETETGETETGETETGETETGETV